MTERSRSVRPTHSVKISNARTAAGAQLSIGEDTTNEKERVMWFTVRLSAEEKRDYCQRDWKLYFESGETEKQMYVYDDNHDEDQEIIRVGKQSHH